MTAREGRAMGTAAGASFFLLLALSSGCVTPSPVEILVRSDSFTAANMAEGGIAVGGVVSSKELWPLDESIRCGELARNALSRALPDVPFLGAEWFSGRAGDGRLMRLSDSVAAGRGIGPGELSELKTALEGVRYVLFGRIEKDDILRTDEEEPAREGDKLMERKTFRTTRTVLVYMEIYDLRSRSRAWAGRIQDTEEDENTYYHRHSEHPAKEALRSVAEAVVFGGHPDPKPLEPMLDAIFVKLGKSLDTAAGPEKKP